MTKNALDWVALILLIIGGLNWGLVGLLKLDLINLIFGSVAWLATVIYVLVGLAGLYTIYFLFKE
ncbi:Uncharacterised protein [uncultured archaeon]|nr:Uncharacterised protein [uncultured archaeon]